MSLLSQFYPSGGGAEGFIDLETLVVAGGGGGAGYRNSEGGGAGGAGGVFYGTISVKLGETCPVVVGGGGAGGPAPGGTYGLNGGRGGESSITSNTGTIRVVGGGGGLTLNDPADNSTGGSGGGARANSTVSGSSVYGLGIGNTELPLNYAFNGKYGAYYGSPGTRGSNTGTQALWGGAGGSSGGSFWPTRHAANASPTDTKYDNNKVNFVSDITGTMTAYGSGGASLVGSPTVPVAGGANTGNGGDGAGYTASPADGKSGGSGIVIVRYPTQFAASPSFPGATNESPSTPGYYTYKFTSSGSITLPG